MGKLIVRIIGKNAAGGARKHAYQLNKTLEEKGFKTHTFIPTPPFEDVLSSAHKVPFQYEHSLEIWRLKQFLVNRQKDIAFVHSHLRNANIMAGCLTKKLKIPHVMTIHGPLFQPPKSLRDRLMISMLRGPMKRSAKTLFISEFVQQEAYRHMGLCVEQVNGAVVYNGSDTEVTKRPSKAKTGPLKVCVVGELTVRKNIPDLLWLADQVKTQGLNIEFHVYGKGPFEAALQKHPGILYHGYEKNLEKIFSDKDLHLILSTNEGFGRVITEAMAFFVPTLCYRAGAFPEIITNDVDGVLCDDRQHLLGQLGALTKAKTASLGRAGNQTFHKRFTKDVFCSNTLSELKFLMKSSG